MGTKEDGDAAPPSDIALEATAPPAPSADTWPVAGPYIGTGGVGPVDGLQEVRASRYEVGEEIGRGGLGRVMRARDVLLDRTVAIKELHGSNEDARVRFVREAMVTARLQHPSIVPVYEAGRWPDRSPFYAMKLVAGRPLSEVLDARPSLNERLELLPVVSAVVDAIAYAHSQRIIHRDLKPQNVIVGAFGESVVIDWGLAKDLVHDRDGTAAAPAATAATDETLAGVLLGTPAYMAPEQAAGDRADERTDVYALGAMLYHLLAGKGPHGGGSLEAVLGRIMTGEVAPLADHVAGAPPDLVAIVEKAMRTAPEDRYPNATDMAADLRRFTTGQLVVAHRYSLGELARRWVRRHRAAATTALVAVLVAAVGVAWFVVRERRLRGVAERARSSESSARVVAETARDEATAAERRATHALAANFVEQGRQELLSHHPARAAAYLAEAYPVLRDDPSTRFLVARAMHDAERLVAVLQGHGGPVRDVTLSSDGRVLTASEDGTAIIYGSPSGAHLQGHTGTVWSAAFSPDQTRVVTASADGSARIWDAATGDLVATLAGHTNFVMSAVFSPDGRRVLTASWDGTARLWDASSGGVLATFKHSSSVWGAQFNHDGTRAVTWSQDRTARIWDIAARRSIAILRHDDLVTAATFSPDARRVLTGSGDGTARLWNAETGRPISILRGHTGYIRDASFSSEGLRIVTASDDGTARVWDVAGASTLATLEGHTDIIESAAFSPDATIVVTASNDRTAKLWDARTGSLVATLEGHTARVISAAFSPNGRTVATGSADGTTRLWDASRVATSFPLTGHTGSVHSAAFSPDGNLIVTASFRDPVVRVWDASRGLERRALEGHTAGVRSASFSPDGTRVVTASVDHTARLWNASTGAPLAVFAHDDIVTHATFSPDGGKVLTASADDMGRIWDADSARVLVVLRGHADRVAYAAFSPDGTRIVTASDDQTGRVWSAQSGEVLATLVGHTNMVDSAAFSPDGSIVATASLDGSRLWDATSGKELARFEDVANSVLFSPDGKRVVTSAGDHVARIRDSSSGALLAQLEGHREAVNFASFSADGGRVVTAGRDHLAFIWDAKTGRLLAELDGHSDEVEFAAFSPDGRHVVTTSADRSARLWDVQVESRTPDEITKIVAERVPWRLEDGQLSR